MAMIFEELLGSSALTVDFLRTVRTLAEKALNEMQIGILKKVSQYESSIPEHEKGVGRKGESENRSLNTLFEYFGERYQRAISTFKLNARILRDMGLIQYGERHSPRPVSLTATGRIIVRILEGEE